MLSSVRVVLPLSFKRAFQSLWIGFTFLTFCSSAVLNADLRSSLKLSSNAKAWRIAASASFCRLRVMSALARPP